MAAVLRPLFGSGKLRELWKHSLEMAECAERLARISRQPVGALKDYLKQADRWEDLRDRLRDDKTLDWLIENAKIQETA